MKSAFLALTFAFLGSLSAAEEMIVEKLQGPVTAAELQAFKSFMRTVPVPVDNLRNAMVYGSGGMAVESLGRMFEISGDRELLDLMLRFTDQMLAARNDAKTGVIVWTGEREAVWPNSVPKEGQLAYAGTETGDVIGHIAYAARLILQNESLQGEKVPDGDPHGFGGTYRERARRYLREMDHTVDAFVLRWLVRADTLRYYSPNSPAYDSASRPGSSNLPVPWNQQMMLNNGFQRLAECHALLGDDASRLKRYEAIVQASVDWFFAAAKRITVNGHECYRWTYAAEEPMRHFEDTAHGGYDVGGLYRAYVSGRYGITAAMMKPFANIVLHIMARPNHTFTGRTDGETAGKRPPGTLRGNWIDLCEFAPELLPILHAANRGRIKGSADTTANLLWTKHRLNLPAMKSN
ncbi:MAG: hypothetical protein IPK32_03560 [Verrucomicrobiaceae bacterium]|nr:hypothetical protein [Verrucomicrobiaceae bacterium]